MKPGTNNSTNINIESFAKTSLHSFDAPPGPPSGHVHNAIEISVVKNGSITMLYGGTPVTIKSNHLIIHWGMLPHQLLERTEDAYVVGLHLPLTWMLQWDIESTLLARLLGLEFLIEPPRESPCSDLKLLQDWNRLLSNNDKLSHEIVLIEVRARLLRLAQTQSDIPVYNVSEAHASHTFFRALQYIIIHFRESIQLSDIAKSVRISSRHLTRIFHQNTGQTINTYITRMRLYHAMRLLVTTDRTVTDIMYDSGFSCTTHFYKAFREQTGKTPRQYR